jgi:EAL domain-containing protein (putative c-di-GMP-specific phosphodiesterase class I)
MRNADIALYRAKHDGRATCRFFEPEMDARLRRRLALEHDLRAAISSNEFELWYQPVFETGSASPCSLEALVRWQSPSRGLVPPNDFIPIAEEKGLIVPIGNWVVRQACKDLNRWPEDIRVAVNVSAVEFRNPNLVASICAAIYEFQVDPSRLELEITESALIADVEHTLATLHELRSLGLTIAMDDFGVGYSSLSYLRSFPFDKLKLDGSFVRHATTCSDDLAIVRAVAGMAESLGMQTTAEGVETDEHLELIVDAGYRQVQGYLFSKPRTADEIEQAYFAQSSDLPTDKRS